MFTQYFGLKHNPFEKETPVEQLYESADLLELDSRLKYLQSTRGLGMVVGEPGSGKSTALRRFVRTLNPSLYKPCYLALSTVTVMDFYHGLARALGETPAYRKVAMYRQIQDAMSSSYYDQKITPVVILDEMHLATNAVLEDLRLLLNFRMDSANPYILILAGQPLIRDRLALNTNAPLRQRIAVRHMMRGLTPDETPDYLRSRLTLAGATDPGLFDPQAAAQLHSISGGMLRPLNNLATACLIQAAALRKQVVDADDVFLAQKEVA